MATSKSSSAPRMNAAWHHEHPMPANASFEQRVQWHLAHQQYCSCRPIPASLLAQMKEKGIKIPKSR
ncbi:MAG: hypothetical protein JNL59_13465 [Chitinophagaceae bacterium]|jgi:hypothetical protein|nr:hypothetical protein [Chitinophagaceae bacterium]